MIPVDDIVKNFGQMVSFGSSDNSFSHMALESALAQQIISNGGCMFGLSTIGYCTPEPTTPMKAYVKWCKETCGARVISVWESMDATETILVMPGTILHLQLRADGDEIVIRALSADQKLLDQLKIKFEELTAKQPKLAGGVYVLIVDPSGIKTHYLGYAGIPIVRDNYTPEVLDDYDKMVEELSKKEPFGRIALLEGPKGTGKTYIVRALTQAVPNSQFIYIPAQMIQALAGPDLLGTLLSNLQSETSVTLIVEDGDEAIRKRDGGNDSQVSTLLNLGSGILGDLLDIRIIITTNLELQDIDEAVARKGRLIRHSRVNALPPEQANRILSRLGLQNPQTTQPFTKPTLLADVYAKAYDQTDNGHKEKSHRKIGF